MHSLARYLSRGNDVKKKREELTAPAHTFSLCGRTSAVPILDALGAIGTRFEGLIAGRKLRSDSSSTVTAYGDYSAAHYI